MSRLDNSPNSTANLTTSNISDQEVSILPASFAQQRLWFIDQMMAEAHHTYNISRAMHLDGQLNIAALAQALNEIVRRHASLRTTFVADNGVPMQVITPKLILELPLIDLSDRAEPEKQTEAKTLIRQVTQHRFDLSQGPLLRTILLRLAPKKHVLLLSMHHIISDGWSISVFEQELVALYTAFVAGQPSPLPQLPMQYADFAVWQREWLQGPTLERQLTYWRERLGDNPPALELPTDYPRPPAQTYYGQRHNLTIPTTMLESLKILSRQASVTLFMTLTAAFKTLLYHYTAQEDITIGAPIANRNRIEIEPLIGFFVNTLALRTDLSGNPTFRQLLKRVSNVAFSAYAHQDLPFEKLVAELQTGRDLSRSPFFQVLFVLQNTPSEVAELPGLTLQRENLKNGTAKFDLTLNLTETEAGLNGFFEYNTDLFAAATIERLGNHLKSLLKGIIANPDTPIAQLPLLTEAERHQILVEWNDTKAEYPHAPCIHHWFEAQVERAPEAIALTIEETNFTYAELNRRANQLARHLQSLGVKPGDLVGLCVERSLEMIVGILGILKAGGAYLPLDPAVPPARMAFILADAQTSILLTQQALTPTISDYAGRIICLDTGWETIAQENETNPTSPVTPDDLAYIIYTSGSTGKPKGVLVTHANVIRLFTATEAWYHFNENDTWTLFHSYAFDFSVWEIWGAFFYGGRLVIVPYWVSRSPEDFYKLLLAEQVTVLNQTPSAFHQLIQAEETLGTNPDLALRYIIFGGEALEMQSLKPWFDRHGDQKPQLVNMYGITETTVHVTYRPLTAADLSSGSVVGVPIPDLQVYILDQHKQLAPIGVIGEMHIGGAGVSRGYLNRPELNAERFIPDPFSDKPEARLYKSGDLARYLPDGDIEYLGRIDHQVQLRGFRIELGEIETTLAQHTAIREILVMAREDQPYHKRLVAYIIPTQGMSPTAGDFRNFLKDKLPDYMIPSTFLILDSFPLTINGKIDRRVLPIPDPDRPDLVEDFVAPDGPVEEMLAEIWQEVLSLTQIGVHDNFFQLGGHSLLAAQVIARLRQGYDIDLPLRALFESPTIAELASIIEAMLIDELNDDEL